MIRHNGADGPIELLTAEEMALADRLAIDGGVPGIALMEAAGRAVADAVSDMAPDARRVAVLCGPGNNGGDGFVVARHLSERGFAVAVCFDGDPSRLPADAAAMAALWTRGIAPLDAALLDGADMIVDALFGAGLACEMTERQVAELVPDQPRDLLVGFGPRQDTERHDDDIVGEALRNKAVRPNDPHSNVADRTKFPMLRQLCDELGKLLLRLRHPQAAAV